MPVPLSGVAAAVHKWVVDVELLFTGDLGAPLPWGIKSSAMMVHT